MKRQYITISIIIVAMLIVSGFLFAKLNQSSKSATTFTPQGSTSNTNRLEMQGKLVAGFPEFPVYPGATVVSSSKLKQSPDPTKGYQAEWKVKAESVAAVMGWYLTELKDKGWKIVEPPNDPQGYGEQSAKVVKGENIVYLIVELDNPGEIEIAVEIPVVNQ